MWLKMLFITVVIKLCYALDGERVIVRREGNTLHVIRR
jgi:hypothetical protein